MKTGFEETGRRVDQLKSEGYFNNWVTYDLPLIRFRVWPGFAITKAWIQERVSCYRKNARLLGVKPPLATFYVYPSVQAGQSIGITPTVCFASKWEIHGHINQSPGHELTHILLGELVNPRFLRAHGFFDEGICVYLDGTGTDRRKHARSFEIPNITHQLLWETWSETLPSQYYPLAGSFIQYLVEAHGSKSIGAILETLQGTGDINLAFHHVLNVALEDIETKWLIWLKS